MMKKILIVACFFVFGKTIGQNFENKVLLTIDDTPVYVSEFLKVYNKNLEVVQDESQKDADEYLQMFINYKLKVNEAKSLGLDENPTFKREFKNYRNQLAHKYLTDSQVTEALVEEAYDRTIKKINASHILLRISEDAAPADTLKVYHKALELREKILNGADFETVAKQYSEDPSVKSNGGDLGWFNAFKMIYAFESAAYNTEVGEISMPVRTSHGYHLVKVNDKRNSQGEVTVAHIMISDRNKNTAANPEGKINDIYKKLQQGENFEELAKEFSDHKVSAIKGGRLNRFGAGRLNSPEFEKVAFSLNKTGEISEPFKDNFGWHIVKLLEKHPVKSLEEMRNELEKQVTKDSRSRVITKAFLQKLKTRYNIRSNDESLAFFKNFVSDEVMKGEWKPENEERLEKMEMLRIKDSAITYKDFSDFIKTRQHKNSRVSNKEVLIEKWHEDFINNFLLAYYSDNLEEENEDFASIAKEYREGLMLFDLMEQKVWNEAERDTVGLKKFFNDNRNKYAEASEFEEIKGLVINDYQNYLEEKWLQELRKNADVEIKRSTWKKIKKSLE